MNGSHPWNRSDRLHRLDRTYAQISLYLHIHRTDDTDYDLYHVWNCCTVVIVGVNQHELPSIVFNKKSCYGVRTPLFCVCAHLQYHSTLTQWSSVVEVQGQHVSTAAITSFFFIS